MLFGSSAGLIGNPGQGAHAAANAHLAAVAQQRHQRGLAGLCVDWGAWGEAGTLTRSEIGERLVASGAALMPPAAALRALGRAIICRQPRLMIAAIEWSRFLSGYGAAVPGFFAAVAPPRRLSTPAARPAGPDPRASRAALAAFVTAAAVGVLGAAPGETPDPELPLNEAGLDGLMALELRKILAAGLDLPLPATLLFNFPDHRCLDRASGEAARADERPAEMPRPLEAPPPMAPETIVENVMRMTEAEMAEIIARE